MNTTFLKTIKTFSQSGLLLLATVLTSSSHAELINPQVLLEQQTNCLRPSASFGVSARLYRVSAVIFSHKSSTPDPKKRRPDITKAKDILGWEPKVSRSAGMKITYNYFKSLTSMLFKKKNMITTAMTMHDDQSYTPVE